MIYSIKANRDTTIYEATESLNSGIDEVLEIQKIVSASNTSNTFNSRILIDFDLENVSQSVAAGVIGNYPNMSSPKYVLNLYTLQATEIDYKYGIEAFPISQSWLMGRGRRIDKIGGGPSDHESEGSSWKFRDGEKYFGNQWASGSQISEESTGSFSTTVGGGNWFINTGSASQSFNYEGTDLRMDVTDIVNNWFSGVYDQEGFIILRSGSQEAGEVDEEKNGRPYGSLQFFSADTHTVYQPKLEIIWHDTLRSSNLSVLDTTLTESIVDVKNMKSTYERDSRETFRLVVREKYPAKTFDTVSAALTNNILPSQSYYSVRDYVTDEVVIPFDEAATALSSDSNGNYFTLWMDQFYPERRYKFVFKTVGGNYNYPTSQSIFDNEYIFKVTK
jgi:hypothetical protein